MGPRRDRADRGVRRPTRNSASNALSRLPGALARVEADECAGRLALALVLSLKFRMLALELPWGVTLTLRLGRRALRLNLGTLRRELLECTLEVVPQRADLCEERDGDVYLAHKDGGKYNVPVVMSCSFLDSSS